MSHSTMRSWLSIRRLLAVLLAASLVLGAYAVFGAGNGSTANEGIIVFGTTIPITGVRAEEGKHTRDGYLLYVDTINARGGITIGAKSYQVKLIYYDDESLPERVAPLYEKLISEDQVDFLLGPYSSRLTAVAVPIAEEHRIPMVAAHGAAESIYPQGTHYTFSIITPARHYLRGVIDVVLAKASTLKTIALLGADEPFAREVVAGATEYARERGLTVVYHAFYRLNSDDLSSVLQAIKQQNPAVLLAAGHLHDTILIVRQAKALGLSPKAIGFTSGPSTPEFRANLKADADYIFGATQWTDALQYAGIGPWPSPRDYADAFRAAYPHSSTIPYQAAESTAALIAYQQAIEQAGSLDREAVRAALAALDIMTFYGRIKFDARGLNIYKPMAVEQLHPDGKKYTVFPSAVAEKEALYPMPPWTERSDLAR